MSLAKVSADLKARTFAIEVSEELLDSVLGKIETLFATQPDAPAIVEGDAMSQALPEGGDAPAAPHLAKPARTRSRSGSKLTNWKLVDLNLSTEQIADLRSFFEAKGPVTQNDMVAVVAVKLKEHLKRDQFVGDEIHSALKLVGRPTPKDLRAVFKNMKQDGIADADGTTLYANSYLDDYVHYRMKKPAESKKAK